MREQDVLRRFLFEELGVRGEWVKLETSWQAAKKHQRGPHNVMRQLGQALAAVTMLSATVKFKGSMILQAQGDGDLKTLVAQCTHDRKIRGLVRSADAVTAGPLEQMFGHGRLVLTIEPENGEPYQGIVPLQGVGLANALETYFTQSEQLRTRLWLFANDTQAAGLLLQELPAQQNYRADWERIELLANTVTEQELMTLDCEPMLHRLFHEEKVRMFDPEPVMFKCVCSRQRLERTLRALGRADLENILKERGAIEVGCEFCSEQYHFDKVDVENLLADETITHESETRH
ncbi:MAG: Hsp33 family molecular chaperone HslO [Methylobacter sp.]|uniref:Hsp33 family molecular chaperone HslO n=1 Tax=Methylobacter sp. TaxID=2051955 RepID=UPI0025862AE2|nr:Hsp33 family molecular chaperone HslO [Methylobacter sp.]MCL7421037.1 Hsp33 family molecular chaperone HslO [Methylobacter sp.]